MPGERLVSICQYFRYYIRVLPDIFRPRAGRSFCHSWSKLLFSDVFRFLSEYGVGPECRPSPQLSARELESLVELHFFLKIR